MKNLKKALFWICVILLLPIVAAGFLSAIPIVAWYKGFDLAKSMIDSGRL